MFQTMKNLTKAKDPYEPILAYRVTPLDKGFSPAELSMRRRLRTTLPVVPSKLGPSQEAEVKLKAKQTEDYNRRHAAKELSLLSPADRVYVTDRKENAVVVLGRISSKPTATQLYNETENSSLRISRKQRHHPLVHLLLLRRLLTSKRKIKRERQKIPVHRRRHLPQTPFPLPLREKSEPS